MPSLYPHRLIILGAGFSRPAGLPLASELLGLVLDDLKSNQTSLFHVSRDLNAYCDYHRARCGQRPEQDQVDLERFVAYLDLEHWLGLRGGDTWSDEGNQSQLIIRSSIGRVLRRRQQSMNQGQWSLYEDFASQLEPEDHVLTFNYDTILEEACDRVGVAYRLCDYRYKTVYPDDGGELEHDPGEVIIHKVHGSIDWFDNRSYLRLKQMLESQGSHHHSPFFDNTQRFGLETLFREPYPADHWLRNVRRAHNLLKLPETPGIPSPLLLTPSSAKMLYADRLRDFWFGFNAAGRFASQAAIIGFSFPAHDEYAMLPLVTAVRNFQTSNEAWTFFDETHLKVVDFQPNFFSRWRFKRRLRFINWRQTDACWTGFERVRQILEPSTFNAAKARARASTVAAPAKPDRFSSPELD